MRENTILNDEENIKISIIIPVYNTDKIKFERCIASIINQTYNNLEIIIVDDGSKSEYAAYLDKVQYRDDRIKLVHKNNEGSAIARNVGVLKAVGMYSMYVDSDDYILQDTLKSAINIIKDELPDIVIGLARKYEEGNKSVFDDGCDKRDRKIVHIDSNYDKTKLISHMIGQTSHDLEFENGYIGDGPWARVFKTELGKKALFTPEGFFSDDTIWNMKIVKASRVIVIVDRQWYAYVTNYYSKTKGFRANCYEEFLYRIKQEWELFNKLWTGNEAAVSVKIWREIGTLCTTFLFHPNNILNEKEKLVIFKNAIHSEIYQKALKNIKFKNEKNILKRLAKEFTLFFMKYGPVYFAYIIYKIRFRVTDIRKYR